MLVLPALGLCLLPRSSTMEKRHSKPLVANRISSFELKKEELDWLPVRPFITAYRGGMLVITCLSILAVDFKVFPRRFAKVENWGTSLMDMGVGSFVFTAGLMAARPALRSMFGSKITTFRQHLFKSVAHSLPLWILGSARLYSIKGLDYAEHVTEYGVHWNFFFTLALLPLFMAVIDPLIPKIPSVSVTLSILIVGLYQMILELTELKAYILTAPRVDMLSKNREGVFSFFGYLAIFLAGEALGLQILPRRTPNSGKPLGSVQRRTLLVQLVMWSCFWSTAFFVSTSYRYGLGLQVSRRLANLPYLTWVSAFNCTQITLFCVIESLLFPTVYGAVDSRSERREVERATSWIMRAFNRNGLALFLVANLLTGLINLSQDTIGMSQTRSMGILLCYAGIVTSLALLLDRFNLSIKV